MGALKFHLMPAEQKQIICDTLALPNHILVIALD